MGNFEEKLEYIRVTFGMLNDWWTYTPIEGAEKTVVYCLMLLIHWNKKKKALLNDMGTLFFTPDNNITFNRGGQGYMIAFLTGLKQKGMHPVNVKWIKVGDII